MKRLFFLVTSLLLLKANPAYACRCLPRTPQQSFTSSQAVFVGRAIAVVNSSSVEGQPSSRRTPSRLSQEVRITFEVSKVWKGEKKRQIVVMTSSSSASCGYSFQQGEEYLVYAASQGSKLTTGLCSGTKSLSMAQADLAVLGEGNPPVMESSILEELRKNQQLWAKQNLRNYRYTLQVNCFCPPQITQPVVIEVRRGRTVSTRAANNRNTVNRDFFKDYDSVDKLFEIIRDAVAKNAHRIEVNYHPTLGYPTKVSIDYSQQMADEERYFTVERLEAIN